MSVSVRVVAGQYRALVTCDTCRESITDPAGAAVVFNMTAKRDQPPLFVHKGPCHDTQDEEIKAAGGFPGWNEFGRWIGDLLHNSGLSDSELEDAVRRSGLMAEFGL